MPGMNPRKLQALQNMAARGTPNERVVAASKLASAGYPVSAAGGGGMGGGIRPPTRTTSPGMGPRALGPGPRALGPGPRAALPRRPLVSTAGRRSTALSSPTIQSSRLSSAATTAQMPKMPAPPPVAPNPRGGLGRFSKLKPRTMAGIGLGLGIAAGVAMNRRGEGASSGRQSIYKY